MRAGDVWLQSRKRMKGRLSPPVLPILKPNDKTWYDCIMNDEPNVTNVTKTVIPPERPYHDAEFDVFLKEIGNANVENWTIFAEAMGVSRTTIARWKKHPLAQAAINTGIAKAIDGMEKSGANDWKMYREKAKMLGVKDKTTIEHEVDQETITDLLDTLGTNYDDLASKARQAIVGQVVATNPPVQNQE